MRMTPKTETRWLSLSALSIVLLAVCSRAWGTFPPESLPALERAQTLAKHGQWGEAIDAYTQHLRRLTQYDYRDKKTYEWILKEYEDQSTCDEGVDYGPFVSLVKERLSQVGTSVDEIATWRYHHILAIIRERQGHDEVAQRRLLLAIKTYPKVVYARPSHFSKLQHLYNKAAFSIAKENVGAAEDFLLEKLRTDARFVYAYLPPWEEFYRSQGRPERYASLVKRVIDAYNNLAAAHPEQAEMFIHFRAQLQVTDR